MVCTQVPMEVTPAMVHTEGAPRLTAEGTEAACRLLALTVLTRAMELHRVMAVLLRAGATEPTDPMLGIMASAAPMALMARPRAMARRELRSRPLMPRTAGRRAGAAEAAAAEAAVPVVTAGVQAGTVTDAGAANEWPKRVTGFGLHFALMTSLNGR